jgi:hypothetical protein
MSPPSCTGAQTALLSVQLWSCVWKHLTRKLRHSVDVVLSRFGSVTGTVQTEAKVQLLYCGLKVPSVQSSHVGVLHLCLSHRVIQCVQAGTEVLLRGQVLLLLLLSLLLLLLFLLLKCFFLRNV